MGRTNPSKIKNWKAWQILFKPKHIKSKDQLLTKYKKPKKHQKCPKDIKANSKPKIIIKSAIDNSNQCLQPNRYLIFYHNYKFIKIDLKTMKTSYKGSQKNLFFGGYICLCTIPNQKYFCINFSNSMIFTIDKSLKILENQSIKPRKVGTIIYLDGLIYLLYILNGTYDALETYDLGKRKWKKAASITPNSWILATFEGKIIVCPHNQGSLYAYDPFCNSFSKIFETELCGAIILLAVSDKLYCIQSEGYVFESLPRDCTQWVCIGKNSTAEWFYAPPLHSLYKDSMYFICLQFYAYLFEFNLKTRNITFVDNIY